MTDPRAIADRLEAVCARVVAAAAESGRRAEAVRIVAVTKKLGVDAVQAAYDLGVRDFGENYVQEAVAKAEQSEVFGADIRWHLLGRLQSNKAAVAARTFALLHAVDSQSTVAALAKVAGAQQRGVDALLQVRLGERGDGTQRGGIEPGDAARFLEQAATSVGVCFRGLMGVADPDLPARPQFAGLRMLAEELAGHGFPHAPLGELSMGMTGDFEDAVREGATLVRIGTAIFGERPTAA